METPGSYQTLAFGARDILLGKLAQLCLWAKPTIKCGEVGWLIQ